MSESRNTQPPTEIPAGAHIFVNADKVISDSRSAFDPAAVHSSKTHSAPVVEETPTAHQPGLVQTVKNTANTVYTGAATVLQGAKETVLGNGKPDPEDEIGGL